MKKQRVIRRLHQYVGDDVPVYPVPTKPKFPAQLLVILLIAALTWNKKSIF